ncbi:MAG: hypothetical protein KDF54_09155 [Hydrogenophaga sp.]|nr:hypothetical protein [Hydrogenophaga sp.]
MSTQLFGQVPSLETLQELEDQTRCVALTYVPVLGWAEYALSCWEAEHGSVEPTPWTHSADGLVVPVPVYRLEETGLVIDKEPGSVKAVLALGKGVTHLPGLFLQDHAEA